MILCLVVVAAIKYLIIPHKKGIEFFFINIISKYKWWKQKNNEYLNKFHSKFINTIIYISGLVIGLSIINILLAKTLTDKIIWSILYLYYLCNEIIKDLKKTHEKKCVTPAIVNTIIILLFTVTGCTIFSVFIPKLPTEISRILFIILCLFYFIVGIFDLIKSINKKSIFIKILSILYFLVLLLNYTYFINIFLYPINSISKLFTGKTVFGEWVTYERGVLGLYKTNGYRVYKSPNGYISEGYFKNNMLNGEGKFRYANGCCVEIGFFVNGRLNGEGKITHEHNGITEGYFINGMLNGDGKIIYKIGCYEEGSFINGKLNGLGKQKHITTNGYYIEEGNFLDNTLNGDGKGTYVVDDNILIEGGIFTEGEFIKGIVNYPSGGVFIGTYIDGYSNKEGKLIYKSGRIEEGTFIDGWLSKGKRIFADGDFEEGSFVDGLLSSGKRIYANGDFEEGSFIDGLLSTGKRIYADGDLEEGSFVDGLLSNGKRIYADGSIHEGSFIYGEIMEGKGRIILPNEDVRIVVFNMGNMYEIPINIHRRSYDEDYSQVGLISRPSGRF